MAAGATSASFSGSGDFPRCVALVQSIFPEAECPLAPCSIQGAHQPPLTGDFVGFSYMYDRTKAIGLLDDSPQMYGEQKMTIPQILAGAQRLCGLDFKTVSDRFEKHPDGSKAANFCGDAVFVAVMLERGFGFSQDAVFTMTNKIDDVEIVWTLGAMLAKAQGSQGSGSSTTLIMGCVAVLSMLLLFTFRHSLFRSSGLLPFRYGAVLASSRGAQLHREE